MNVPFADLSAQHKEIAEELHQVFTRVLDRSSFILGSEVEQFEEDFAKYLDAPYCIAVNSGTAALHLALLALGIGSGDEVITVPNTFIATAEAISAVGATPIFVDVDPVSYTMDPAAVENAITPRTRALLPVHLFGQTADMDPLCEIANRHGIALIEDACQAHGATYKGKKAGTLGIAGCFSFYPGKNLGSLGEAGAVVTHDRSISEQIRMLRDHGSVRKYEHRVPGFNFRMEGLQGGFLAVKLKHLDKWNAHRTWAAGRYEELLSGQELVLPRLMPYAGHVYHLYVIQAAKRDELRALLSAAGVDTGLHYPLPLHLQVAYQHLGRKSGSFPVSERLAQQIVSLPMHPGITDEQIGYVAGALIKSLESLRTTANGVAA